MKGLTDIEEDDGVVKAKTRRCPFDTFAQAVKPSDEDPRIAKVENDLWSLAHLLFDDYEDGISRGVPAKLRGHYKHRIRKDRLSDFWETIIAPDVEKVLQRHQNHEERAIVYLAGHDIKRACEELVAGKNFRLATLVAQINSDRIMRTDLRQQIDDWCQYNVLSEMSEPIRAIYGLLAGHASVCNGKLGHAEDKASTFDISRRFDLSWKMAFGLHLWYGIETEEPLEAAVSAYRKAYHHENHELMSFRPSPWFLIGDSRLKEYDPNFEQRESGFWVLLRTYASLKLRNNEVPFLGFPAAFMPENVHGNPLNAYLSFILHRTISPLIEGDVRVDEEAGDRLTIDFAAQLETFAPLDVPIFALLHLSSANSRRQAIQTYLARNAARLGSPQSTTFTTISQNLKIPAAWLWDAKALHARAVTHDRHLEVSCLLAARNWEEAHRTLCQVVGPNAVISRDYDRLHALLEGFQKEGRERIEGWSRGGGMYKDFLEVVQRMGKKEAKKDMEGLVRRLVAALMAMKGKERGLLERVAVGEMARVLCEVGGEVSPPFSYPAGTA